MFGTLTPVTVYVVAAASVGMRNAVAGGRAMAVLGEGSGFGTLTTVVVVSVGADAELRFKAPVATPPDTTTIFCESTTFVALAAG